VEQHGRYFRSCLPGVDHSDNNYDKNDDNKGDNNNDDSENDINDREKYDNTRVENPYHALINTAWSTTGAL
jgi:hypothetical protein